MAGACYELPYLWATVDCCFYVQVNAFVYVKGCLRLPVSAHHMLVRIASPVWCLAWRSGYRIPYRNVTQIIDRADAAAVATVAVTCWSIAILRSNYALICVFFCLPTTIAHTSHPRLLNTRQIKLTRCQFYYIWISSIRSLNRQLARARHISLLSRQII